MTEVQGEEVSFASVGRSALILTGGALAVQVVGILRELFVASKVGISPEYDALLVALALPASLAGLLTIGATTALVPAYIQVRDSRGVGEAQRFAGAILLWLGLAGVALAVILFIFAWLAVAITGPGLSPSGKEAAVGYVHVLAPVVLLTVVSGILGSVCQAEQRFAAIAWAGIASSSVTFVVVVGLWGQLGLWALVMANLLVPS